jgi:hypothetical protein
MCIPDYNQDAILFIDVGGKLIFNKNDAGDRGWGRFARKVIREFPVSFHLALFGYGDADMMNYFSEDGTRMLPAGTAERTPLGATVAREVDLFGTRFCIPFSSLHRFSRTDSAWASEHSPTLGDYRNGFSSTRAELLPAFVRYDCLKDQLTEINPPAASHDYLPPEHFGDVWSEPLEKDEVAEATSYFRRIEKLEDALDFLTLRVGGKETRIEFAKKRFARGLTIEAPRNSLMTSVKYEIFDDLLIGNFAKVICHGEWGPKPLYPDVAPYIVKYADNGRARTRNEVNAYLRHYRNRAPADYVHHVLTQKVLEPMRYGAAQALRKRMGSDSRLFQLAKSAYWTVRGGL